MTASDARPPSDEPRMAPRLTDAQRERALNAEPAMTYYARPPSDTGTTGIRATMATMAADVENTGITETRMTERPGIWIDPAEARETIARTLACLEPGEDWPTNRALGGNLTGTRDDEYRDAMYEDADRVLAALGSREQP